MANKPEGPRDIAKKIIEKHNGLITAKSKVGEGASFIIVLPLKYE